MPLAEMFLKASVMKMPKPPKLVRFMAYHAINGIAIGCTMLLVMIWIDFAGLGTMLKTDTSGIATFLLFFQTSLTFGGISMAIAVMNLGEDDED